MSNKFNYLIFIDDDVPTNIYHEVILEVADLCNEYKFFEDSQEALAHIKDLIENNKELPELIFLDLHMPGLSGWDFLDIYKTLKENLPEVIILTTSLNPLDKEISKKYKQVRKYMNKPLEEELIKELLGVLNNS